jgi:archaellum component FlaC
MVFLRTKMMDLMDKYLSRVKPEGREKELKPISDENLQDMFLETMNKVNKSYIEGLINYIQEHHKDLDGKINNADDRINGVWKECNEGEASIETFNSALVSYECLYLEAIKRYEEQV